MSDSPPSARHPGQRSRQLQSADALDVSRRRNFDDFYRTEMKHLIKFLMYQGASAFEADDAAHTALTFLLPDEWQRVEYPRAWLRTTALRCYWRQNDHRQVPTQIIPDRPGGIAPVDQVLLSEESDSVLAVIRQLPPAQRDVLAWSLDGFSNDEIAAALNRTPEAVRTSLCRARRQLKIALSLETGESHE